MLLAYPKLTRYQSPSLACICEILYQRYIWICDTGASSHSTNSRKGDKNAQYSGSTSPGHSGAAVEATITINLLGKFVVRDGSLGMKGVLTEVNYSESHNFNPMSTTMLLCKGWRITKSDATGITIENGSGGMIEFDVVIPTERGAVFACRSFGGTEIGVVSTDFGMKMNIV